MSSHHTRDDAWLALQYVLGELGPSEQSAFEARLPDDPALCQQVADVSLLLATLQAAAPVLNAPMVAVPAAPPRRKLAAVISVAVAALCLVLAVLPRDDERSIRQPGEAGTAAKLVSFWRGQAGGVMGLSDEFDDERAEWSNDQVPGWMIAAVSLEHRKHTTGENSDDEWEEN